MKFSELKRREAEEQEAEEQQEGGEYLTPEQVKRIEGYTNKLEAENTKLKDEVNEMLGVSERVVELEIELRDAKDLNKKFQEEIALLKQDAESLKECKLNLAYWHRRAQNLEKRLKKLRPSRSKPSAQGRE